MKTTASGAQTVRSSVAAAGEETACRRGLTGRFWFAFSGLPARRLFLSGFQLREQFLEVFALAKRCEVRVLGQVRGVLVSG
jgi:hypothetical protein